MKKNTKIILIMGMLTAIGPFSIDMYLPAFPDIARSLHTEISEVTLSLSSFFIGVAAGQLLYGPLLERFGRKKPLYGGLSLYLLASAGCASAQSVDMLILLRFFQAMGGCVGMVAVRAMVRDLFDVKDNARVFSMLMLVISVSPIIAPTLGGYITGAFGWRYVFAALVLVVLIILAATYFFLPETRKPDPNFSLKPAPILKSFAGILKNPHFLTYALAGSASFAGLYAYIGGASYVFMEIFKVTEEQFGWIFAFIAAGLIGASQLNNLALKKYSGEQVIKAASIAQSLIGILFVAFVLLGWTNLFLTIFLIFCFLGCQGFIFPNSTALALAPLGHAAGNASALIGAIQMGVGACAPVVVSVLQNHSALPMASVMAGCAIVAYLIFSFGTRIMVRYLSKKSVMEEEVEMISTL